GIFMPISAGCGDAGTSRSPTDPESGKFLKKELARARGHPARARSSGEDPAGPEGILERARGGIAAGHAVHPAAGMRGRRAEIEAFHRRPVPEPPGDRPEDQLVVDRRRAAPDVATDQVRVGFLEVGRRPNVGADDMVAHARGVLLESREHALEERLARALPTVDLLAAAPVPLR